MERFTGNRREIRQKEAAYIGKKANQEIHYRLLAHGEKIRVEGPCDFHGASAGSGGLGQPGNRDQGSLHGRPLFLVLLWGAEFSGVRVPDGQHAVPFPLLPGGLAGDGGGAESHRPVCAHQHSAKRRLVLDALRHRTPPCRLQGRRFSLRRHVPDQPDGLLSDRPGIGADGDHGPVDGDSHSLVSLPLFK